MYTNKKPKLHRSPFVVLLTAVALAACAGLSEGEIAPTMTPVPFVPTVAPEGEGEAPLGSALADPAYSFKQELTQALTASPRDYAALTAYMGDSFEIMIWYGNAEQMSPADAVMALQDTFLPPGNTLTFVDNPDYEALIGENPFQFYMNAYDFLFARGWGSGNGEAILHITEREVGSYYWSGILFAWDGFAAVPPPIAAAGWVPLSHELCQELEAATMTTLGAGTSSLTDGAPFDDPIGGTSGTGCLITVTGTGTDFANPWEVFTQLEGMLVGLGWTPDENYRADGPTGTGGGFRRDSGLILVMVEWVPSPDANCPPDQPIGACELAPEQRLYTITLSAAMQ